MRYAFALALFCTTALLQTASHAEEQAGSGIDSQRRMIPHITITKGYWSEIKDLPGAAYYVPSEDMEKNNVSDINRALRQVPGVNVQEEDGFGLRPNIGMRGGRVDRSADITLMEDGVLIAPAPYASPEAYYFPRIERMEGIEVRKGSSSIKYGPRTTNGALNLLSRTVPDDFSASTSASYGSYGTVKGGVSVGKTVGNFGALLEAHHAESDGFKDIDFVGGDTGFNIQDTMGKLRYRTDATADFYQEFEFKFGFTDERSNETYVGLTDADFNANPYRRYAGSQVDEMDASHKQFQFSHYMEPTAGLGVTTTLYRNSFSRAWYKLQSVRANGSKVDLANVLSDPTTNAAHLNVLKGANSAANGLQVRDNNRDYLSTGIQTAVNFRKNIGAVHNDIEFGVRHHSDEQDRFQRDDEYQMTNGVMTLSSAGAPGSESNRIGSADAVATYLLNRMEVGNFSLTPGVRYEHIELSTEDFGKSDPTRSGAAAANYDSTITAVIPGIGADYTFLNNWTVLGGVHKGFAPPEPPANATAADNAKEEESVNYEAGLRYSNNALRAEAIGFLTDYENLLGRDTFSAGGTGGDQFNGGEVEVHGLEANLMYNFSALMERSSYRYPLKLAYTYTKAEFQDSFNSSFSEWGNVTAGDELPYIPQHQLYASIGIETDEWLVAFSGKYNDEMRTVAGSGPIPENEKTDSSIVFDLNGEYEVYQGARAFAGVSNLFDEEYIAARRPAGLRPGSPQILFAGMKVKF